MSPNILYGQGSFLNQCTRAAYDIVSTSTGIPACSRPFATWIIIIYVTYNVLTL